MSEKQVKATVLQDFFDSENRGLVLKVGQIIERSKERITFLESKGLVKAEHEDDGDKGLTIENFLTGNGNQIKAFLKTVTADDLETLKAKLEEEEKSDKPRAGVQNDIKAKIAELEGK